MVGDLIPIIASGGINPIVPGFNRVEESVRPNFERLESRFYIAFDRSAADTAATLGEVMENGNEIVVITEAVAEADMKKRLSELGVKPLSLIRFI